MSEWLVSVSPADPADEIGRFAIAGEPEVEAAVARARRAFPAWRDAGFEARARILRRFAELAREGAEELARLIAREVGKALWDARGEAALLATKVELTLADGMSFVAPIEAGAGARAEHLPRGVLAVLGPFNFPAHLPNGHIVPALATGNTVVFKPSDLAPGTAEWMARALEARRPAGGGVRGRAGPRRDGARAGAAPGRGRRALHRLLGRRTRAPAGAARPARQAPRPRDGRQERDRRARGRRPRARRRRERALDLRQHGAALLLREPPLRRARRAGASSANA